MAKALSGLSSKRVLRALQRGGYVIERISGSHHVLRNPDVPGSKVIIALHGNKSVAPGTMKSILTQAKLSREDFIALL